MTWNASCGSAVGQRLDDAGELDDHRPTVGEQQRLRAGVLDLTCSM